MDRETNIDSIRALEEEVKEHERAVIKLKRTRNSLLNVSKLPPEVLGNIFCWNVIRKGDFDGLEKGSHNFLLVCHHWFEVASRTPDLWSFWGITPKEWSRRHNRSGTARLDLVLGGYEYDAKYFDDTLRDTLKDRAAKDIVRRVHLEAGDTGLMRSILDSLTPDCEELRPSSMESLVLWNRNKVSVDVSNLFAHYRFPKLQRLDLSNCTISSWDHLTSRTSILTILRLDFGYLSPTSTTSQLLSILSSNPALQRLALLRRAVPDDSSGESSARVQLHHLKYLRLEGGSRHVSNLLNQLDYPRNMDLLSLALHHCDDVDASRVVGPYLRDYLRRRDKAQNGLGFSTSSGYRTYRASHVKLHVGDAGGINFSNPARSPIGTFFEITMFLNGNSRTVRERAVLDLVACIPQEEVVYFKARNNPVTMEDIRTRFPNIRALSFDCVLLTAAFPSPRMGVEGKTFPPLEYILLEHMGCDDDWSPLVNFLASCVSSGNHLDTLVISNSSDMPPEVVEDIRGMVRELKLDQQGTLLFDTGPDTF